MQFGGKRLELWDARNWQLHHDNTCTKDTEQISVPACQFSVVLWQTRKTFFSNV
jgi:hypothetical protein